MSLSLNVDPLVTIAAGQSQAENFIVLYDVYMADRTRRYYQYSLQKKSGYLLRKNVHDN